MSRGQPRRGAVRRDDSGGVSGPRLLGSAAVGVLTFVVGFAVTFLLKSDAVSSRASGQGPGTEHFVAWLFYKMHNVGHEATASSAARSQTESFDPSTWTVWEDWLFAVPPALLLVGGLAVGYLWADGDVKTGATYGAALVLGYLPLAALGGFLAQYTQTRSSLAGTVSVTAGPKLAEALALAGIGYPLVFGLVGGAVAGAVGSSDAGDRRARGTAPADRGRSQGGRTRGRPQGDQSGGRGQQGRGGQQQGGGGQRRGGRQQGGGQQGGGGQRRGDRQQGGGQQGGGGQRGRGGDRDRQGGRRERGG